MAVKMAARRAITRRIIRQHEITVVIAALAVFSIRRHISIIVCWLKSLISRSKGTIIIAML